jgi:type II secretion system protein I
MKSFSHQRCMTQTPRGCNPSASPRGTLPHKSGPSGMTLLEVVLAMAIFFGSLAVLSQLVWSGSRAAIQGRLQTQALIRCEATLNEVAVGVIPLQATGNVPFTDDANWTYSIALGETRFPELLLVQVTVAHTGGSSLGNVTQTLTRWQRDPAIYEAALEAQAAAASESSSTDSTSTSGGTQ